jgi:hypothetical protein
MASNERALLALGLIGLGALGTGPGSPLASLRDRARGLQARDPAGAVFATVLAAGVAFHAAERGRNPKVSSLYDALVYASTNISVGYSDILARTPAGKLLGALLMSFGPALAARALDAPAVPGASPASDEALREIAGKLDAILSELRARPARAG